MGKGKKKKDKGATTTLTAEDTEADVVDIQNTYASQHGKYDQLKFIIELVDEKGEVVERWRYNTSSDYYFNEACKLFKQTGDKTVQVPKEKARYRYITTFKKALPCAFTATENYVKTMFGCTLTKEDKDFFVDHPAVEEDGLPLPSTLRVIQEVVSVYGLRVARVRLAPGTALKGDLATWVKHLGMNPLAQANRNTDNRTFAEQMGMSIDAAHKMYRMEYSEEALRPSIACGTSGTAVIGQGVTGITMGHATFLAPRGKTGAATLSLQLSKVESDPWLDGIGPVYEDKYKDSTSTERSLDFFSTVDDERKVRGTFYSNNSHDTLPPYSKPTTPAGVIGGGLGASVKPPVSNNTCEVCRLYATDQRIGVYRVCEVCWFTLWNRSACLHKDTDGNVCDTLFRNVYPKPEIVTPSMNLANCKCPKCKTPYMLSKDTKYSYDLVTKFFELLNASLRNQNPSQGSFSEWDGHVLKATGLRWSTDSKAALARYMLGAAKPGIFASIVAAATDKKKDDDDEEWDRQWMGMGM